MAEKREATSTVVLLGRFNPLIFHPSWLSANKIIGASEANTAIEKNGIEVMLPDVCSLKLDNKNLIVEAERFTVTALDEPLVQARDFAASSFSILSHTPAKAIGLNDLPADAGRIMRRG